MLGLLRSKVVLFFFIVGGQLAFGQTKYSNSWIEPSQDYVKISFKQSAIYRLELKDIRNLKNAITQPLNIQIFQRGIEITKVAKGLEDGIFNEGDYYEFYLEANQGEQDSVLYKPNSARPKVYDNLYSDDSHIFLTVGKGVGKVVQKRSFELTPIKEDFHLAHDTKSFKDSWSFNNLAGEVPNVMQSYYERGESWTGNLILSDAIQKETIQLNNYQPNSKFPVRFEALVYTRSRNFHNVAAKVNDRQFARISLLGFDHSYISTAISDTELKAGHSFEFSTQSLSSGVSLTHSWTNYTAIYPQKITYKLGSSLTLYLPNSSESKSNFKIENSPTSLLAYDISNPYRSIPIAFNEGLLYLEDRRNTTKIFINSDFRLFGSQEKVTFKSHDLDANYIIVTHPSLRASADMYKEYRSSVKGGGYKVEVLEIQDIYNQFNYGERSPIAIREYLRFQVQNTPKDRYLLLVGKSVSFPNELKNQANLDLVPTFGYPGSDALLSTQIGNMHEDIPAFLTGRLSATKNEEVIDYLNKVKEYESSPLSLWKKNVLHLNGGNNANEVSSFKKSLEAIAEDAKKSATSVSVNHLFKQTIQPTENVNISSFINDGTGLVSYFGHGSSRNLDFNIGYASNQTLGFNNKGKYPFMYFNGCGVANVFYQYNTLSADWLFTPNKGSVLIMANSYWSFVSSSSRFLSVFYDKLYNDKEYAGKSFAAIQKASITEVVKSPGYNEYDRSNSNQLLLQGDPTLVLYPFTSPDYTIKSKSIGLQSANQSSSLKEAKEVILTAEIDNLGLIDSTQNVEVTGYLEFLNGESKIVSMQNIDKSSGTKYSEQFILKEGLKKIKVVIDEKNQIIEYDKANNATEMAVDWDEIKNNAYFPYASGLDFTQPTLLAFINDAFYGSGAMYTSAPVISFMLKDENPLGVENESIIAYIKVPGSSSYQLVPNGKLGLSKENANLITGLFHSPDEEGEYEMIIRGYDKNKNSAGKDLILKWGVSTETAVSVLLAPNPTTDYIRFKVYSIHDTRCSVIISDASGREITKTEKELKTGPNEVYIETRPPAGVYFYTVTVDNQSFSGKIAFLN